jgi:streptogramin lyase
MTNPMWWPMIFPLVYFDGVGFKTIRPQLPYDAQPLWTANAAFQDSAGEWWVLTKEKLYRFAATSDVRNLARQAPRAIYDHRDGLKGDLFFHIFEDSRHDLWIGTRDPRGLSRWSRTTGKFYAFSESEGLPPEKAPTAFAEDRNGNLWVGFYEGGLVRYSGGRFTEFTAADGSPSGLITALLLDQQGRLWIGSAQSGLSRVDDPAAPRPRFVNYTIDRGLASNNVRAITEDLSGNVYVGTARGVDRLSSDASRIKHYSIKHGLTADFVTTAFRDRGGALWFGTPNGVSRLLPKQEKTAVAPRVWVSGLQIAGERRPISALGSAAGRLLRVTTISRRTAR